MSSKKRTSLFNMKPSSQPRVIFTLLMVGFLMALVIGWAADRPTMFYQSVISIIIIAVAMFVNNKILNSIAVSFFPIHVFTSLLLTVLLAQGSSSIPEWYNNAGFIAQAFILHWTIVGLLIYITAARLKDIDPLIVLVTSILNVIYVTGFITYIDPFYIVNDPFFKDIRPVHLFMLLYAGFVVYLLFVYLQHGNRGSKKRR